MKYMGSRFKILLGILLVLGLTFTVESAEKRLYPPNNIQQFLGLDDTSAPPTSNDGHAADLQNMVLDETGKVAKRNGYSVLGGTLDTNDLTDTFEPVTSVYELYKSNGTRYILTTCANKLFWYNSGTWTQLVGPTITEGQDYQWSWITALDYAIGTNGTDPPIKTNITSISVLNFTGLTNSVTTAKCVTWWKNYLIVGNTVEGGTSHITRIRWSSVGTIETWSNDDYVDIATLGGQQIEGFGTLYDDLFVFLTDSIYKVSLVGGDELITVVKISDGIGCIAKNSIQNIQVGNVQNLIFLARDKRIYSCDSIRITEISSRIQTLLDTLKTSRLPYAISTNDTRNSHYYLAISTGENSTNNLLLDLFYKNGEWSKHTHIYANALGIANDTNGNPQIYYGNYDSFIYQLNDSNLNNDVKGFAGTFDDKSTVDTSTESGLMVIYDNELSSTVVFLSHFEGTNGSTSFKDETGKTITPVGNAQISTAQYKIGTASGLFDGAGDYISLADSADWNFGSGNFTIDFWIRVASIAVDHGLFGQDEAGNLAIRFQLLLAGTDYFEAYFSYNGTTFGGSVGWTPSSTIVADTWYHIALVRSGTTVYLYQDGVQNSATFNISTNTINNSTAAALIARTSNDLHLNGNIDEFRISNTARYTASFTPSTTAYDNSGMISGFVGALLRILSGTGADDERTIVSTTATGLVVSSDTTATGTSVYSVGDIDGFYVTKWSDMSEPSMVKNFGELYVWAEKKVGTDMELNYATEISSTVQSTTIDLDAGDIMAGTSILETDTWSGTETNFMRKPLNVSGRFLKVRFREDDIDETMELYGYSTLYWSLSAQ